MLLACSAKEVLLNCSLSSWFDDNTTFETFVLSLDVLHFIDCVWAQKERIRWISWSDFYSAKSVTRSLIERDTNVESIKEIFTNSLFNVKSFRVDTSRNLVVFANASTSIYSANSFIFWSRVITSTQLSAKILNTSSNKRAAFFLLANCMLSAMFNNSELSFKEFSIQSQTTMILHLTDSWISVSINALFSDVLLRIEISFIMHWAAAI
jgi:hypothetical protein